MLNSLQVTVTNLTWSPGDCESQDLLTSGSFSESQATLPFEELPCS